jgi:hypothetical protein
MAEQEVREQVAKKKRGASHGAKNASTPSAPEQGTSGGADNAQILSVLEKMRREQAAEMERLSNRVLGLEQGPSYFDEYDEEYDEWQNYPEVEGGQSETPDPENRFSEFSRRFTKKEVTGKPVDEELAAAINSVFHEGLTDEIWVNMAKEVERPDNCSGLARVRTNGVIWDNLSPEVQRIDSKLQKVQESICKAACILTYLLQDSEPNEKTGERLVTKGMEAMAFLGHASASLNFRRREIMKPQIERSFHHLCSPAMPFTDLLFGDNLTKEVRDISESMRISGKMRGRGRGRGGFHPYRGRARGQGNGRGRGGYYPKRGQGRGRGTPTA